MNGSILEDFEFLQRINNLVDFLRVKPITLDTLMNYLLIDTFYGLPAFGHVLHVVRNDGSIESPAMSGFKSWPIDKFPERFITVDTPLNRSLRTGEVVPCGSFETYPFAGTGYQNDLFPNGFASSVAWPVPGIGSVLSFFNKSVDLTPEMRSSLILVGKIISLGFQENSPSEEVNRESRPIRAISNFALTVRQWNILEAVRRGKTNPEIAQDFGFSESLVRQETMRIYRSLAINGRKELIDMPQERFPSLEG